LESTSLFESKSLSDYKDTRLYSRLEAGRGERY
jgi:hypothetical protein